MEILVECDLAGVANLAIFHRPSHVAAETHRCLPLGSPDAAVQVLQPRTAAQLRGTTAAFPGGCREDRVATALPSLGGLVSSSATFWRRKNSHFHVALKELLRSSADCCCFRQSEGITEEFLRSESRRRYIRHPRRQSDFPESSKGDVRGGWYRQCSMGLAASFDLHFSKHHQ